MASISTDAAGNVRVQFHSPDRKWKTIRFGKVPKKVAEAVRLRVEHLANALLTRTPVDPDTAAWVAGIGDDLAAKLAAVGLIPERKSQALGTYLDGYLAKRKAESKPTTVIAIHRVTVDLLAFFGPDTGLRHITEERADAFKTYYLTRPKKLAPGTVHRRLKNVRMIFDHARRLKLIPSNPFAEVSAPNQHGSAKKSYVTLADTEKLLAAANPCWRTIVALCRFAGLRNPTETLMLRWEHVDFAANRMTVPSVKTEHLEGKSYRVVPIFAKLRQCLEDAYELASAGEINVVHGPQADGYREAVKGEASWGGCNMRETFEKLICRVGLQPWPRLFHNLRASCETDLMQNHPIHVVTAWIGNTPKIALGHYLQTLDADFDKAVKGGAETGARAAQTPAQTRADSGEQKMTNRPEPITGVGLRRTLSASVDHCHFEQLGEAGLEPA